MDNQRCFNATVHNLVFFNDFNVFQIIAWMHHLSVNEIWLNSGTRNYLSAVERLDHLQTIHNKYMCKTEK